MRYFVLALLPLSLASCATPNSKPAPAVLTISATPQQTMRGWGIYPCTIQNDRPNAQLYTLWKRPNAARLIWRDLGATYWRSEILPGSYDAKRDDGSLDEKYLDESLVRPDQVGALVWPDALCRRFRPKIISGSNVCRRTDIFSARIELWFGHLACRIKRAALLHESGAFSYANFVSPVSIFRQAMIGMALVVVSLPVLFLAHNAMGLGKTARRWTRCSGADGRDFDGTRRSNWRGRRPFRRRFGRRGCFGFSFGIGRLHHCRADLRRLNHRQPDASGEHGRGWHGSGPRPTNFRARKSYRRGPKRTRRRTRRSFAQRVG